VIPQVREAIARRLETVGLNVHRHPAESISPPAAVILRGEFDPVIDHQGGNDVAFTVLLLVQTGTFPEASRQLDTYVDPDSPRYVVPVIEADQSLGGLVGGIQVNSIGAEQLRDVGGVSYTSCAVEVEVIR
jgi:hypothetical protein